MNSGTLFLLLAVGLASSAPAEDQGRAWALTNTVGTDDITEGGLLTKHWTFFARMLNECGARGLEACLGSKALAFADGYLAQDSIPVAEGVALVRRNGTEARASEDEGEDSGSSVVQQLMGRFARFLRTFAVQLKFPETDQEEVAIGLDEGRKLKKFLLPMLLGIGVKVLGVIPLVFGALALLVGKAAFVSKLAFAIAALTGLSTIMGGLRGGSSSGGGDTRLRIPLLQQVLAAQPAIASTYAQPAVVSSYAQPALTSSYSSQPQATQYSAGSASGVSWPASSGSSSGGWSKRSLPLDGQQMAYAEQIPHDYYE